MNKGDNVELNFFQLNFLSVEFMRLVYLSIFYLSPRKAIILINSMQNGKRKCKNYFSLISNSPIFHHLSLLQPGHCTSLTSKRFSLFFVSRFLTLSPNEVMVV